MFSIFRIFRIVPESRYLRLTTDPLTQFWTRAAFDRRVAQKYRYVWFFDINNLGATNNEQGHAAGDMLIAAAAEELRQYFRRKRDYMTRWGGDELIVCSDRATIPPLKYCSVGRAELFEDLDRAIEEADAEMYKDKEAKKSRHNTGSGIRNLAAI